MNEFNFKEFMKQSNYLDMMEFRAGVFDLVYVSF